MTDVVKPRTALADLLKQLASTRQEAEIEMGVLASTVISKEIKKYLEKLCKARQQFYDSNLLVRSKKDGY